MRPNTLKLIGHIYDAVNNPDDWNVFFEDLSRYLGGHAARFRLQDKTNNQYQLIGHYGHDDSFDQLYYDYFSTVDFMTTTLKAQDTGIALNTRNFYADKFLEKTEIYNDFFLKYDAFHIIGANITNNQHYYGRIGIHRSRSQGPFDKQDEQLLQTLLPHLQRGFELSIQLQHARQINDNLSNALYQTPQPLIFLDQNSQAAFINQRAEEIINSGNGLSIIGNRIYLDHQTDSIKLQQLINQTIQTGYGKGLASGGGLRLYSKGGIHTYNLIVIPYSSTGLSLLGFNGQICAVLFLHEVNHSSLLPENLLKDLYNLSPSEIRLAQKLLLGMSLQNIAIEFEVSVYTIRAQLRSLFSKTETQSQTALIRLLMGLSGTR